jgi:hypothetical protein
MKDVSEERAGFRKKPFPILADPADPREIPARPSLRVAAKALFPDRGHP